MKPYPYRLCVCGDFYIDHGKPHKWACKMFLRDKKTVEASIRTWRRRSVRALDRWEIVGYTSVVWPGTYVGKIHRPKSATT